MKRLLFAAAMLASAAPVLAPPALADPRVATHFYRAGEVVTVHGRGDIQSTIVFGPDERIENVAVGNSADWQVAPNKRANLLFLKPMKPGSRTNMAVVTDQRTYLFDLVSAGTAAPVYMLSFTYPDMPPRSAAVPVPAAAETVVAAAGVPPAPAAPDPAGFNFAWTTKGDRTLLPARVFDDGRSTFLQWPRDAALPAILTSEGNGAEGPVNYTSRGDTIVVDGVPAMLILRSGRRLATLAPGDGDGAIAASAQDHPDRNAGRRAPPAISRTPYAGIVSNAP